MIIIIFSNTVFIDIMGKIFPTFSIIKKWSILDNKSKTNLIV